MAVCAFFLHYILISRMDLSFCSPKISIDIKLNKQEKLD